MVARQPGRDGGDRGQAFTLEAFTASLLLIGSIIFALQVTAVTPLTASTSSQHIENQQLQIASGVLDSSISNDSLREAVLFWNESDGEYYRITENESFYAVGGPPGLTFSHMVNRTFRERGIAFNVNILYIGPGGNLRQQEMVRFGTPSDNAVSARRTLTLFDDDQLTAPINNDTTLSESDTFYAEDMAPDSGVYNVVRVEIIAWRM